MDPFLFRYSVQGVNVYPNADDIVLIRLVAEVLSKIHREHSGDHIGTPQSMSLSNIDCCCCFFFTFLFLLVQLIDHVCVEDPAMSQHLYFPTTEDFQALRVGVTVPTEAVQRLSQLVWAILQENKDLPRIPVTQEEVLQLVSRVEEHRIPILRKKGKLQLLCDPSGFK